jgi:hypothetical protein
MSDWFSGESLISVSEVGNHQRVMGQDEKDLQPLLGGPRTLQLSDLNLGVVLADSTFSGQVPSQSDSRNMGGGQVESRTRFKQAVAGKVIEAAVPAGSWIAANIPVAEQRKIPLIGARLNREYNATTSRFWPAGYVRSENRYSSGAGVNYYPIGLLVEARENGSGTWGGQPIGILVRNVLGASDTSFHNTSIGLLVDYLTKEAGSTATLGYEYAVIGRAGTLAATESYGGLFTAIGAGTNYGVYALASGGTTNYAGYFVGPLYVSGNGADAVLTLNGNDDYTRYVSGLVSWALGFEPGTGEFRLTRAASATADMTSTEKWKVKADGNMIAQVPTVRTVASANTSCASGAWTAIAFAGADNYDNDTMHDPSVNNTRIYATTAGKYRITFHAVLEANGTGVRYASIYLNGAATNLYAPGAPVSAAYGCALNFTCEYPMSAGQYIECMIYQDSGGALNAVAAFSIATMTRVST